MYFSVKSVKFKGTLYKTDDFLIRNDYCAVKIKDIFASEQNETVTFNYEWYTIQYELDLRAYRVYSKGGYGTDIIDLFDNFPSHGHLVSKNIYLIKYNI